VTVALLAASDEPCPVPDRLRVGLIHRLEFALVRHTFVLLGHVPDMVFELAISLRKFCRHDIWSTRRVYSACRSVIDHLPEMELVHGQPQSRSTRLET
jgi:hypothetical protein